MLLVYYKETRDNNIQGIIIIIIINLFVKGYACFLLLNPLTANVENMVSSE